jgi:hypothetical protein
MKTFRPVSRSDAVRVCTVLFNSGAVFKHTRNLQFHLNNVWTVEEAVCASLAGWGESELLLCTTVRTMPLQTSK